MRHQHRTSFSAPMCVLCHMHFRRSPFLTNLLQVAVLCAANDFLISKIGLIPCQAGGSEEVPWYNLAKWYCSVTPSIILPQYLAALSSVLVFSILNGHWLWIVYSRILRVPHDTPAIGWTASRNWYCYLFGQPYFMASPSCDSGSRRGKKHV